MILIMIEILLVCSIIADFLIDYIYIFDNFIIFKSTIPQSETVLCFIFKILLQWLQRHLCLKFVNKIAVNQNEYSRVHNSPPFADFST